VKRALGAGYARLSLASKLPPPSASITVQILCAWDRDKKFLAVDESKVAVRMAGKAEPLFRWEFLRAPSETFRVLTSRSTHIAMRPSTS
jgi:hypothetical protein